MNKRLTRGAGILLPISALPSDYGIGSLGREAFRFVDFLQKAGQRYWQVLPLGPTSYGDSPYQSFSAFAGNPYFIDLPTLYKQGLLTARELEGARVREQADIDYATLYTKRFTLLHKAFSRFSINDEAYLQFCKTQKDWLEDYALYMSIKGRHQQQAWTSWEPQLRDRQQTALQEFSVAFSGEISFWKFCQYQFYCQWLAVKTYANAAGIRIIGDIPIYVAADSADVWANRNQFELDGNGMPSCVAGVPPDCFSETGQRWGNPLYRYEIMAEDGYAWWKRRIAGCARLYDVIRIDHFIGLVRYYAIPADCDTAKAGVWRKGPGKALTDALETALNGAHILAEDLGILHPSVRRLLKRTGYPGMKVLLFAFDGDANNEYLPHNYPQNTVVYGGTHDNETIVGYCRRVRGKEKTFLLNYLNVKRLVDVPKAMIRAAYQSVADVAIFQMQDILALDNTARMNTPSTLGGNWKWRLDADLLTDRLAEDLYRLSVMYGREREEQHESAL